MFEINGTTIGIKEILIAAVILVACIFLVWPVAGWIIAFILWLIKVAAWVAQLLLVIFIGVFVFAKLTNINVFSLLSR